MVVTYHDLVEGYILKDRDTLACIHGITGYMVLLNSQGAYQLFHHILHSGEIYRILEGRLQIPTWSTSSELTKEVLRLYATPKFKVGEKVTIAKLTQSSSYPYGVTYEMAEASGETYVIQEVKFDYVPIPEEQEVSKWKGDFHRYHIGRVRSLLYDWHSSMFTSCQTPKPKENLVPRSWKEQREWDNSRSKNTEVAKEDMAQMLNASRKQLLEAIEVHPNSKVNTDIVL